MADLEKMILAKRQNGLSNFIDNLEKKYCGAEQEVDEDGWIDTDTPKKRKPSTKPAQPKKQRKV